MTSKAKDSPTPRLLTKKQYARELEHLQTEAVVMQEWIRATGYRLAVLFEGRDTSGKGGTIKRFTYRTNPRYVRTIALGVPTERERSQWYYQRYVEHLPASGEMVLFDRSWYNRAGVEKVMGFCTDQQYEEFLVTCPAFENLLLGDGIHLIKYWLSVSDDEQRKRFQDRLNDPARRWKLSPIDLEAQSRWVDYAEAKDVMFAATDTDASPWFVVEGDDKKSARLNLIAHLLTQVPYEELPRERLTLPDRQERPYQRPPMNQQRFVPSRYIVE